MGVDGYTYLGGIQHQCTNTPTALPFKIVCSTGRSDASNDNITLALQIQDKGQTERSVSAEHDCKTELRPKLPSRGALTDNLLALQGQLFESPSAHSPHIGASITN